MRSKVSVGEYLAFLSTKYELDPDDFFHSLNVTEKDQEVACGELSITCRSENKDRIIVLIAKGSKVIAQFPVPRQFLLERNNPIKDYRNNSLSGRSTNRRNGNSSSLQIKDLRTGMKKISLKAKILEIPKPKLVFTRFGNYASVANALIGDNTGTIKLCLWNEQINSVSIGDVVQIGNARMSTFRGESQLRIGKKGTLNNLKDADPQLSEIRSC